MRCATRSTRGTVPAAEPFRPCASLPGTSAEAWGRAAASVYGAPATRFAACMPTFSACRKYTDCRAYRPRWTRFGMPRPHWGWKLRSAPVSPSARGNAARPSSRGRPFAAHGCMCCPMKRSAARGRGCAWSGELRWRPRSPEIRKRLQCSARTGVWRRWTGCAAPNGLHRASEMPKDPRLSAAISTHSQEAWRLKRSSGLRDCAIAAAPLPSRHRRRRRE